MRIEDLIQSTTFLHQEHQDWLSQLNFYQDEIKFYQNELAMVLHRHLDRLSIIENVEEYKQLLLKKLRHIDELRHRIVLHEKQLAAQAASGEAGEGNHAGLREEFSRFVSDFELLKKNFKRFAAHND